MNWKKNIYLVFILIISFNSFGQDTTNHKDSILHTRNEKPFNRNANYQTINLKGKILIWPLGDDGGLNITTGIDYGFAKKYSLGADYVFNCFSDRDDSSDSLPSTGAVKFNNALFVNYRYYLNFRKKHAYTPYLGVYYRYSETRWVYENRYITDNQKEYETNNSIGILFGTLLEWKKKKGGIDVNFGVHENFKLTETLLKGAKEYVDTKENYVSVFLRFNLYFWFKRK